MTTIQPTLPIFDDAEVIEEPEFTVAACRCAPGGTFHNLPGSTLAIHECGLPKPRALLLYAEAYEEAFANGDFDVALQRESAPTLKLSTKDSDAVDEALDAPAQVLPRLAALLDADMPALDEGQREQVVALRKVMPHLSLREAHDMIASL